MAKRVWACLVIIEDETTRANELFNENEIRGELLSDTFADQCKEVKMILISEDLTKKKSKK